MFLLNLDLDDFVLLHIQTSYFSKITHKINNFIIHPHVTLLFAPGLRYALNQTRSQNSLHNTGLKAKTNHLIPADRNMINVISTRWRESHNPFFYDFLGVEVASWKLMGFWPSQKSRALSLGILPCPECPRKGVSRSPISPLVMLPT